MAVSPSHARPFAPWPPTSRYGSNIGVLLLNKYLLSIYGFKFPVFLTLCHMVACSVTSYAVAASRLVPLAPLRSRRQLGKVAVLAVVFCLTVVLGNVSLRFIPVSFNQAVGATTPAFTAAMSLVLLHQRESRGTYLSLVPVMLGIVIASGAEPLFNLLGFAAAISATGARAFKSVLQVCVRVCGGARWKFICSLFWSGKKKGRRPGGSDRWRWVGRCPGPVAAAAGLLERRGRGQRAALPAPACARACCCPTPARRWTA